MKKLGKHTVIYGVGDVLGRISAFILLPVYTTYLTPEEFGTLEILYMTSAIASIFLGRQISHATIRFYFEYDAQSTRNRVVSSSLILFILFSGIILTVCATSSKQFSNAIFSSPIYAKHFTVLFYWLLISLSNEILYSFIRVLERPYFFVTVSLCELLTKLICCTLFVVGYLWAEFGVLLGNLLGTLVTFFILGTYTFAKCGFGVDFSIFRHIVKYTLPLIFVGFCATIIAQADRFFLKTYASLSVVGLYALGIRFSSLVNFLVFQPFTKGYGPFRFSIMQREDAKEIYAKVTTYFLFIILWACLGVTAFAREIIQIMADSAYWPAYQVIPILLISVIGQGLYYMFQIGVYINKNTRILSYVFAVSTLVNLICLWVFVPRYGIFGAALSLSFTHILISVLGYYCSNQVYPILYEWSRLIKNTVVFVILAIITYLFYNTNPYWSVLMKLPILLSYPLILWVIGFFSRQELDLAGNLYLRLIKNNGIKGRAG
ncbi:MAG: oligosaccharide flippase family protein [Bacteroidales bacterium]|nr:oligosaccharide flippase family protein [Bacteroidales bacterium]